MVDQREQLFLGAHEAHQEQTKPQELATTVSLREVLDADGRLEASAYNIEARNAVRTLNNCGLPLINLYGHGALCHEAHNAFRFKRIFVEAEHGVPFISSAEINSLRPRLKGYLSKKLTKRLDELIIQNWDILISCSGTIGNIALAADNLTGIALTQDAIRLRAESADTAGYIAAFLRGKYGKLQIVQTTYGSVIPHIEPQHLEGILIPTLHPVQRIELGRKFVEAAEARDAANRLLDAADNKLHEELELPYLSSRRVRKDKPPISKVKASKLFGRLEASFHAPEVFWVLNKIRGCPTEFTTVSNSRVAKEIRAITKFRKRVYVQKGGIPMLSSKQLFQYDPIDVKRLAKGAHTKDLPEIGLKKNMVAITCSGTIGRVQIIPGYMEEWTANQHATRIIAAGGMNPGFLYAWLASDIGHRLITRHSYGSVILEADKDMLGSVPFPLPDASIRDNIGNLVLAANDLRDKAWRKEREAIKQIEELIEGKQ